MTHSPQSAAKAVRAMYEHGGIGRIAKTWDEYFEQRRDHKIGQWSGEWLNHCQAALLVCEQVYGVNWRDKEPDAFEKVMPAIEEAIPELFGNYWMELDKQNEVIC